MSDVRAFKEWYQDARQCPWCRRPVEGSGVYWAELRLTLHQGACNLELHRLVEQDNAEAEIWRVLAEHE